MVTVGPLPKYDFAVFIEGEQLGRFTEVSGMDAAEPIEYREGASARDAAPIKMPRMVKHGTVTFKYGKAKSSDLIEWWQTAATGDIKRKNVVVSLFDETEKVLASWMLMQAWPVKCGAVDLNVDSNYAIESIELAHEGVKQL